MAGLLSIARTVLLIQVVYLIQSLTAEDLLCDPKEITIKDFDIDKFLGVWHEIYHYPTTHQERYLCFIDNLKKSPAGDITITSTVYDKIERKRQVLTGTVQVTNNYVNLTYEGHKEWSTQYYVLATDYTSYAILAGCPEIESKKPNAYVLFRSADPAESVKTTVDEALKSYNLNPIDFYKEC